MYSVLDPEVDSTIVRTVCGFALSPLYSFIVTVRLSALVVVITLPTCSCDDPAYSVAVSVMDPSPLRTLRNDRIDLGAVSAPTYFSRVVLRPSALVVVMVFCNCTEPSALLATLVTVAEPSPLITLSSVVRRSSIRSPSISSRTVLELPLLLVVVTDLDSSSVPL